jgi:regulator of sigma E protease
MLLIGILVGLLILTVLVVVHELGHALVAKRNGVVVEEFGIGFPPKAWAKKVKKSIIGKNVRFSVNWLPLGGFVKLQGEHDAADQKGDYGAATYWQKTKILLAGVVMNWALAIVLFTVLALSGMPKLLPDQFSVAGDTTLVKHPLLLSYVEKGSPAEKAGMGQGDELLRINGRAVETSTNLFKVTNSLKGESIEVIYKRGGEEKTTRVALRDNNDDKKGYLGVVTREREELRSTWSAPIVGLGVTMQFTGATFAGIGQLLGDTTTGFLSKLSFDQEVQKSGDEKLATVSQSVTGPVGILGIIFPQAQQAGLKTLTLISAVISLSLAVMNVLPIPALDGGRWATMTVYKLRRKKLTKEREEKIQMIGFVALMGLVVLVTIADVAKF